MNEFINEFGKENFMIIIAVVLAIVFALVIIVVIEKLQAKAKIKKQIKKQLYNMKQKREEVPKIEDTNEKVEDYQPAEDKVVYVENENDPEEAKEKLDEVTKRLAEEQPDLIDHTHFETKQEEDSVISYEELVKNSKNIDATNDKLLEDEGEAAITLEELYKKHADSQNIMEEEIEEVSNPIFEDDEPKKFKNSEVISPVFGYYSGKIKQSNDGKEILEELDSENTPKDLEEEIKKTEDFLSELKRLKNKLD